VNNSSKLNAYLAMRNDAIISCDVVSDDRRQIGANAIVKRTLSRLQRQGKRDHPLPRHGERNREGVADPAP